VCAMFKRGNVPEPKDLYRVCTSRGQLCGLGKIREVEDWSKRCGCYEIKNIVQYEGDEKTEEKDYLAVRALMHPKAGLAALARPQFADA